MQPAKVSTTTPSKSGGAFRPSQITVNTRPVDARVLDQIAAWAQRGGWTNVSVEEQLVERHGLSQNPTGRTYYGIGFEDARGERSAEMYHDPSDGSFSWRGKPIEDRLFG